MNFYSEPTKGIRTRFCECTVDLLLVVEIQIKDVSCSLILFCLLNFGFKFVFKDGHKSKIRCLSKMKQTIQSK